MLLTVNDPRVKDNGISVIDCRGTIIPYVKSYDTETKEVEILIRGIDSFVVSKGETEEANFITFFKGIVPGSKAIDRTTGKEII